MFPFASRVDRVDGLRRIVAQSACPTHALVADIVAAVAPHHLDGRGERSIQLRRWLDTHAFLEIGFVLIDWELPNWSMRRLAQDDGLWWCAVSPRQAIQWGHDEVDESHENKELAVLKAFLTALCHVLGRSVAIAPEPGAVTRASAPMHWW
jgi:hypothetical protein